MTKTIYLTNEQWQYAKTVLKSFRETDKDKRRLHFELVQAIFNGMDVK